MTLLVETRRGLRQPLPPAHRGARTGRAHQPVRPAGALCRARRGARLPDRLRAPRRARRTPTGPRPWSAAGCCARRSAASGCASSCTRPLLARRPRPHPPAARSWPATLDLRLVRHERRARPRPAPRRAAGRPRRHPLRPARSRPARPSGAATASTCSRAPARDGALFGDLPEAVRETVARGRALPLRPHPGPRLPLPLGRRRGGRRRARADLRARSSSAATAAGRTAAEAARAARRGARR